MVRAKSQNSAKYSHFRKIRLIGSHSAEMESFNTSYTSSIIFSQKSNFNKKLGISIITKGPGQSSLEYILTRLKNLWINAHSFFLPFHMIIFLIKVKKMKKCDRTLIKKSLRAYIKSCCFATLFSSSLSFRGLINPPKVTPFNAWATSAVFSCFFLLEARSRWAEVSIFSLANWLEGMQTSFKKRRVMPAKTMSYGPVRYF